MRKLLSLFLLALAIPSAPLVHAAVGRTENVAVLLQDIPQMRGRIKQPAAALTPRQVILLRRQRQARKPASSYLSPAKATAGAAVPAPSAAASLAPETVRRQVLDLVNQARGQNGLQPLERDGNLESAAQTYAEKMDRENFFSHVPPDGQTFLERIKAAGYLENLPACACQRERFYGENLAHRQLTAREVMDDWMSSPEHKANILRPEFRQIGIGFLDGYWVQEFGGLRETK